MQQVMLKTLLDNWREPDHGIWEVRGPARHFTHSRLMSWVAFDRAVNSVEHFGLDGPVAAWRAARDEIRADILTHGFDTEKGSFVQHYGGKALDAALLLIPQVGFLPVHDPRVKGTIAAIERELRFAQTCLVPPGPRPKSRIGPHEHDAMSAPVRACGRPMTLRHRHTDCVRSLQCSDVTRKHRAMVCPAGSTMEPLLRGAQS